MTPRQGCGFFPIGGGGKNLPDPRFGIVFVSGKMVVEIDCIGALSIVSGDHAAIDLFRKCLTGEVFPVGDHHIIHAGCQDQVRSDGAPEFELGVLLHAETVRAGDQHIDQYVRRPCPHIHSQRVSFLGLIRGACGDPDTVSPFLFGFEGGGFHIPDKVGQDLHVQLIVTGLEDGHGAHPVQFDPVRFIVQQIFPGEIEVILIHIPSAVIETVIAPVTAPGVTIPRAEHLLMIQPEVAVLGLELAAQLGVVNIVHPHAVPHFDTFFVAVIIAVLHEIRHIFVHGFRPFHHGAVIIAVRLFQRETAKTEVAIRIKGTVFPDGGPHLCIQEGSGEIHIVKDGFHAAGIGIKIHIIPDRFCGVGLNTFGIGPEVPRIRIDKNATHFQILSS